MKQTYRLPEEWYPQSGIQLTWPHEATDWKPILDEVTETYVEMARKIALREKLIIVAPQTDMVRHLLEERLTNKEFSNIRFVSCPTNDTWARDHSFITLLDNDGFATLLDFCFNGWGEKFPSELDNSINVNLFNRWLFKADYESHLDFVLEGGAIESDGKGTIFTTLGCHKAPNRNQPLSIDEVESQLKERLRAERIVWISYGHIAGDDTDGHIDTLVRIAPNDTLLHVFCDNIGDEHYHDLKRMREQLQSFTTLDGKPYRLIALPLPDKIMEDGERLPATYANFLVINGAVLVPTYGQPDNDRLACERIKEAFPDREIIGINCRSLIKQHGSLHCCAMQFPQNTLE